MYRQGKYTKKAGLVGKSKVFLKRRWQWWQQTSKKKKALIIGAPILAFLIITPIATYAYYYNDIGNVDRLLNKNNTGVVLTDTTGKVFFSSGRAEHRELVPLTQISDDTEHALIASEDKDFYNHGGFSPISILRAMYTNVLARGIEGGGSTLTQQLAKNTLLSSRQTILRKYQELTVATAIEARYSKDQILDMYLNSVFYGENSFGIEEAAKNYFNTTPDKLDLAQSAMLVGVLPAPTAYSPISGDPKLAKERQTTVLTRMVKNGYITDDQKTAALSEQLNYATGGNEIDNAAPHFTEMVLNQLYDKYGEETVKRSGYQVKTTLDLSLQDVANTSVANGMAHINANGGSNASLVAIDPKTGSIRALVGSANYANTSFGKFNMATALRQPGSSFKPIYYSDALARGVITPTTVLDDTVQDFGGYTPLDADRSTRGNVTVRQALNWSLNIPSVEVMQKESVESAIAAAKSYGITTLSDTQNYGLAFALGVAEVPLDQMTNAYAAMANGGVQYGRTSIESIDNKYGSTIFTAKKASHEAISQQGAYLISNILSDNQTRSRIFGSSLNVIGTDGKTKNVAVKTGTTEDSRDAWTIGYTPDIAIGVWVGNNDNTPMDSGGSDMAGPIWRSAMKAAVGNATPSFTQPAGIVKQTVCTDIGQLTDVFLSTNVPAGCQKPQAPAPKPDTKTPPAAETKCTVAGKEDLAANDPNCKEDTTAPTDTDGDGVPDSADQCPATVSGATVDAVGCAPGQTPSGTNSGGKPVRN